MTLARSVLLILLLLTGPLLAPPAGAQGSHLARPQSEGSLGFTLEQNYPEAASPETWIPFFLSPELFAERSDVSVTLRIVNMLAQTVAIPEAIDHPAGPGARVIELKYADPGRKIAYWDGKDLSGRLVPTGVYYIQIVVDDVAGGARKVIVENPSRQRRRLIPPW